MSLFCSRPFWLMRALSINFPWPVILQEHPLWYRLSSFLYQICYWTYHFCISLSEKCDCHTRLRGSACSAHSMNIVLQALRTIIINHSLDANEIDSPGEQICGHQNPNLPRPESRKCWSALGVILTSINALHSQILCHQSPAKACWFVINQDVQCPRIGKLWRATKLQSVHGRSAFNQTCISALHSRVLPILYAAHFCLSVVILMQ